MFPFNNKIVVCLVTLFMSSAHVASADIPQSAGNQEAKVQAMIAEHFPNANERRTMAAIARCESTMRHRTPGGALLPNEDGSSARGAFQVLMRIHEPEMRRMGLNPNNDDDYMRYVRHLYDQSGTTPWNPSRHCWAGKARA